MMATVPHVTSGLGLRKFQARWIFVDTSVPKTNHICSYSVLTIQTTCTVFSHVKRTVLFYISICRRKCVVPWLSPLFF